MGSTYRMYFMYGTRSSAGSFRVNVCGGLVRNRGVLGKFRVNVGLFSHPWCYLRGVARHRAHKTSELSSRENNNTDF